MKYLFLIFIALPAFAFSQIDFGKQVKKKNMKDVTFFNATDNTGNTVYGFQIDGKLVGPNMVANTTIGVTTYSNYNTNNDMDGTTVVMNNKTGDIEMYTYRKNMKEGPAFQLNATKIGWRTMFEKDKPTDQEYKVNHTFDYNTSSNYTTFDGFSIEKYKTSQAIGYFAYGRAAYPIIFVYNEGGSYYGQCIQGQRKEFGVFFYSDKSKYVGAWHQGYKEGLGFKIDANGKVTEKGFYDAGKLKVAL